eukprot:EG_transcript_10718
MILITHIVQHLQLVPLMQIGFGPAFLVADFAGPASNVLLLVLTMRNQPILFLICALTFLSAVAAAANCHTASKMQRAVFLLEVQRAHASKQAQQADAMVNHILKNAMVEASGLIDVFLELCLPAPPAGFVPYLQGALERLHSGVLWCRRRGALLTVLGGEGRPALQPTPLREFGAALVAARAVACDFACCTVELNEVLADLMLENAISNAFRHGHPTDPDVRFSISVEAQDGGAGTCTVVFRVTNRRDPTHQPFTAKLVDQLLSDSSLLAASESVGLQHCFLAAQRMGAVATLYHVYRQTATRLPGPPRGLPGVAGHTPGGGAHRGAAPEGGPPGPPAAPRPAHRRHRRLRRRPHAAKAPTVSGCSRLHH